jgi:hypothetical protein
MRISRLLLHNFRGWNDLDLRPDGHVLLAGVPRAGRSDIIAALIRLLDPASIRLQPALSDIRQRRAVSPGADGGAVGVAPDDTEANEPASKDGVAVEPYAEVEVTLVELDAELEQLCDGFLEPLDSSGQIDASQNAAPDAALGVRLAYRVSYDLAADALTAVVFFPLRSNPATEQYARVPTAVRRALPVVVLGSLRPLQLRAEGVLRRLVIDRDPEGSAEAFQNLSRSVAAAADALSAEPAIAETIDAVLRAGGLAGHLGDSPPAASSVRFRPDDGSLAALLRAVQPALDLDEDGLLMLSSHGSTASTVLSAAEALLVAASVEGAIIVGDDFGDALDSAAAEHLANVLRASADQLWITTRRPEVARAFRPGELVRLSRGVTGRGVHLVPEPSDKKEVALRRLLHAQLLPALTATVVAISEGFHDLTAYSAADRYRSMSTLPLASAGVRLICADNGAGGGTSQIPRVATLARALGFLTIAIIDGDPAKRTSSILSEIEAACDAVVRLPDAAAIEVALTAGVDVVALRTAAAVLPAYGVDDPTIGRADGEVADVLIHTLHSKGVHEQFLDALVAEIGSLPPLLDTVLDAVVGAALLGPGEKDTIQVAMHAEPAAPSGDGS